MDKKRNYLIKKKTKKPLKPIKNMKIQINIQKKEEKNIKGKNKLINLK